ncbi:MAG: hypothetical protein WDZ83_01210 [Rhizobiaceae bacterium]
MDWNFAIDKHREALKRVLAALAAMAGLGDGQSAAGSGQSGSSQADGFILDCRLPTADCFTLPRHLHRAVLRLLRPAESAVRRLVIVAARGIEMPPRLSSPPPGGEVLSASEAERGSKRKPKARRGPRTFCLPLTDPLRRAPRRPASRAFPRISIPGYTEPAPLPIPPAPDDEIDARRLTLRLAAIARALDDLPREARRFARWRSRNAVGMQNGENRVAAGAQDAIGSAGAQNRKGRKAGWFRRISPLRGGRPPGQRPPSSRRPAHAVHQILDDVHGLAFWALEAPDTS